VRASRRSSARAPSLPGDAPPPCTLARGLVLAALLTACGDDVPGTPDERLRASCAGEVVEVCPAHSYAVVDAASLEPSGLRVGEVDADARVRVRMRTCGVSSPGAHAVRVDALVPTRDADGGAGLRTASLFTLRDDGAEGDAVARDGVIEVTRGNPFTTGFPPDTAITLRFSPELTVPVDTPGGRTFVACNGAPLEVPYVLGPRFTFPGP
jgi:hypothetical protein